MGNDHIVIFGRLTVSMCGDICFRYMNWKLYELMCSQNGMSPYVPCHNPIMVVVSVWV